MKLSPRKKKLLACSFCGKAQGEVKLLIAGPKSNICDDCVDICVSVVRESEAEGQRVVAVPKALVPK